MADEIDHIGDLQQRLYARDPENIPKRKFGILRPIKQNISSTWGEAEVPHERARHPKLSAGYKRFFIFSFIFFIIGLGIALYSIYHGSITLSSKNVEVKILGNSFVGGGEELPIQIEITNKNAVDLTNTILSIDYPRGATDQSGSDVMHIEKQLGTIGSGKTKSEEVTVVLYGEQGLSRSIKARVSYQLAGSSSTFQREQDFAVIISSSPVTLTADGPSAIVSSQPFTLTIRNNFTGDKALNDVITRVEYPNGFVFKSADPAPVSGNNVWSLGDLEKGTERIIKIQGRLMGEENDEKSFRIYTGTPESATDRRLAVTFNSVLHPIILAQPFISAEIAINGDKNDVVPISTGATVTGTIHWKNNSPLSVVKPLFTLLLGGEGIDVNALKVDNGYYNALDHTITWTPESDNALTVIAPGQEGDLMFTFPTKQVRPGAPDMVFSLSVSGVFPDRDYFQQTIDMIDQKTVRFASTLQFAAQSLYSIGPIKNTGPYPPKADIETTYTLTWTVRPSENALTNVQATAALPNGVIWSGVVVPQSELITYNTESKVVTWNIGTLPKANGSALQKKTVSFQVKARPTRASIDSDIMLLGETMVTATDTAANAPLTTTRPPLTTRLDSDPVYTPGGERVLP